MATTPTYLVRFYRDGKLLHAQRDTSIADVLHLCQSSGAIAEIVLDTTGKAPPACKHAVWSAADDGIALRCVACHVRYDETPAGAWLKQPITEAHS